MIFEVSTTRVSKASKDTLWRAIEDMESWSKWGDGSRRTYVISHKIVSREGNVAVLEGHAVRPARSLDEVDWRIDMGARVRSHVEARHVARCALGDGLGELDPDRGISRKHGHPGADRDSDIDPAAARE